MRRSFELTKGRFWQVVVLGLTFTVIILVAIACFALPAIFFPELDHWLIDAATSLISDLLAAYGTFCLLAAYVAYSNAEDAA